MTEEVLAKKLGFYVKPSKEVDHGSVIFVEFVKEDGKEKMQAKSARPATVSEVRMWNLVMEFISGTAQAVWVDAHTAIDPFGTEAE